MDKYAVLMSVYKNDNREHFKISVESVLNQTIGAENIHLYLGIDGAIPDEIQKYIDQNKAAFYKIITNSNNEGLPIILNKLIDCLDNEKYVFRMDSDDICIHDRFEKQIKYMNHHLDVMVLGGAIEEFDTNGNTICKRTYPSNLAEAKRYIAKASPFAHPTVCFRRTFFNKGIRYPEKNRVSEDVALWYEVIANDIQISNLSDVLLRLRVTPDFYKRRSYKKAFGEFGVYTDGIIRLYSLNWRLVFPVLRLITRVMPPVIVKCIYSGKFRRFLNNA